MIFTWLTLYMSGALLSLYFTLTWLTLHTPGVLLSLHLFRTYLVIVTAPDMSDSVHPLM